MYEEVEVIEKWRWVALVAMDHHRRFHVATPTRWTVVFLKLSEKIRKYRTKTSNLISIE